MKEDRVIWYDVFNERNLPSNFWETDVWAWKVDWSFEGPAKLQIYVTLYYLTFWCTEVRGELYKSAKSKLDENLICSTRLCWTFVFARIFFGAFFHYVKWHNSLCRYVQYVFQPKKNRVQGGKYDLQIQKETLHQGQNLGFWRGQIFACRHGSFSKLRAPTTFFGDPLLDSRRSVQL